MEVVSNREKGETGIYPFASSITISGCYKISRDLLNFYQDSLLLSPMMLEIKVYLYQLSPFSYAV